MTLNEKVAAEMREQRLLKNKTLQDMADGMGYASKNTVSRMELGSKKITLEDLKSYCDVLGISWLELLNKIGQNTIVK